MQNQAATVSSQWLTTHDFHDRKLDQKWITSRKGTDGTDEIQMLVCMPEMKSSLFICGPQC